MWIESAAIRRRGEGMTEWNYYFELCHATLNSGGTVRLPGGHGIVTLADDADGADCEKVFFPARQSLFTLVPGVMALLERHGLATRYGKVRG